MNFSLADKAKWLDKILELEDFRSHVYGSLVINIKEEDKEKITAYLDEVKVLWEVLN